MKRVDTIVRVRRAFHVQGWSVKKIVRELHVSRNTVRNTMPKKQPRQALNLSRTERSKDRSAMPTPRSNQGTSRRRSSTEGRRAHYCYEGSIGFIGAR
nr:helix-turn-helix domain-containing protein [Neorhizobium tomejilense]